MTIRKQSPDSKHLLSEDLDLAHRLADIAAEYALSFFRTDVVSETKENGTPVTEVDFEIEKQLRTILGKERPADGILGEEFGERKGSGRRWLIDPIDGTSEFLAGNDNWGNHITLEENGELILGVINRPSLKRRWWATKNGGAFHASVGNLEACHPVVLSSTSQLSKSHVTIWEQIPTERVLKLKELGIWVPPSLSNIIDLLEGKIEAFIDVLGKPWDHGPVAMIVSEAGGTFRDHQGGQRIDIGEVCYTNGKIDIELLQVLNNS